MSISDAKATIGLTAIGTPIGTNLSGTVQIGESATSVSFTTADVAYSVRCILAAAGDDFVLAVPTGTTSASDAWTAGTAQVETATIVAASGCTSNGTMAMTLTAAGMTGSPRTINVALTTTEHTTAALIATAARAAINADTVAAARLTASGTGADIVLTINPTSTFTVPGGTLDLYPANDATLNLAIPSGLGVTAAATSTGTTAGIASAGAKIYDGDAKDYEGITIPTIGTILGVLVKGSAGGATYTDSGTNIEGEIAANQYELSIKNDLWASTFTFNCNTGPADFTITVVGSTT